jgi:hypothetical protein
MLFVSPLVPGKRVPHETARGLSKIGSVVSTIPGVTHVDGTARVQTVDPRHHPRFYRLLLEFERQTRCPVLLNTSFNLRGEPIVCTPDDAIRTFLASGMDALVLGPFLIDRPAGPPRPLPALLRRAPSVARVKAFARDLVLFLVLLAAFATRTAVRRGSIGPALLALGLALAAVCVAWSARRSPRLFLRPTALWQPAGDRLGRALSSVCLGCVYFTVVAVVAMLRGRRRPLTMPLAQAEAESYWRDPEAPRGGPNRMF